MNCRKPGKINKFDKMIKNGLEGNFEVVFKKPKVPKKLDFYEIICKKLEFEKKIFYNLKENNEYLKTVEYPTILHKYNQPDKNKHQESFLYRLFYCYRDYITQFKRDVDNDEFYSFQGLNKIYILKDKRVFDVEKEILSNYARDIINMSGKYPFPENIFEFLYDFFIFLSVNLTDLAKINQLESDSRYNTFFNLILKFKRYVETHDMHQIIQQENNKFGWSPLQKNIVNYICETIGLF